MKISFNRLKLPEFSLYKLLLFLISVVAIVYLFPKGGKFKYDYIQGKPWQYQNLYAPFDFAIQKSVSEISKEKEKLVNDSKLYFYVDLDLKSSVLRKYKSSFDQISQGLPNKNHIFNIGKSVIQKIYAIGFVQEQSVSRVDDKQRIIALRSGNNVKYLPFFKMYRSNDILSIIKSDLEIIPNSDFKFKLIALLSDLIRPNVKFDVAFTDKELNQSLMKVSLIKGMVSKGELIVLKGDIVGAKTYNIIESFKLASKSYVTTNTNYFWIVLGYTLLVSLAMVVLLLFIKVFRESIFIDNKKVTFIFVNVLLLVFCQTLVEKYNVEYLYVVPMIILPIVIKTFFDATLALFTHVLTVLLLGFIVPDSFEYIYLHIISGIATVFLVSDMAKRANLFIAIAKITFVYMLTYVAFSIIKEGNPNGLEQKYFFMFLANGLLSFLAVFFVYFYEKLFGLVSDVTLLELSNTNSELLRRLNDVAPGTFHHSLQVANLSEACANEIGANSMLVRTGALYHDIGKISNPQYFIENQYTNVNPHNDLSPTDSAKMIIDHVISGIEIAKKYNLPDRIIDFIRTHHGTSSVYYFYKKALDENPENTENVNVMDFKYKGPIPYSKETAILMLCDACEAASRSLKDPSSSSIDMLVDKVFKKQSSENQFINSDLTFKDMEKLKKVIKTKLLNIYHLRVEYPD